MPLSYQTHSVSSSASGSGLQFSVTYSFLLRAHVKLYYGLDILAGTSTSLLVDGVDYNWTSSTQVTLTSAPSSNQTLTIIRDTPDSTQQVVWQDGSNLIADDMNTADKQNLFVVQEQQDRNDLAATKAIDSETASNAATTAVNQAVLADGTRAMTGNLNANSNKVVNLANPTAGGDAVNKTFADATYQPLDAELTELATMAGNTAAALADLTQAEVNILDGATVSTSELNTLDGVTASTAELNKLDGVTSSTAELNILDGVTATASELNALDGITATTTELNKLDGVTASTAELNTVDGVTSAIQTQLDGKQPLDAELTELATMQSTTASALADLTQAEVQILDGATVSTAELNTLDGITSTTTELNVLDGVTATTTELNVTDGLTASTSELNQLDGKTISSTLTPANTNDIPTSSAINTFVSGLLNALGGFVAIPNETSFPTTNPDPSDNAGTVVSIADAGGVVVDASGVSTTGRTTGNVTVTITGFPSSLQSTTLGAGLGLQVQTTSTLNTYTYHKLIAKETDITQLSDDINDFNARYRVSDNAPTTDLDEGDLWYDKTANKMKVYDTSTSAWKEVQSVGNFFINTLSSSGGTGGGSATFNGSAYRFTLSNAGANAQQMLVSVNGVIQKPNSGTSQPSEGFAIDNNDIIFAAAPASGASHFIVTIGSTVNIGQPSNNTVDTSELVDGAVTNAKVSSSAAIASSKLAKPIDFADNEKARFGTGNDLEIFHDGNHSQIKDSGTGNLQLLASSFKALSGDGSETYISADNNGAVDLYHANSKKLATKSDGIDVTGEVQCDSLDVDGIARISSNVGIGTDSVTTQGKLYIVADSGNSNDVKIGLSPTNSSGGTNPLAQVAATANGTYGSDLYFTTRTTGGTTAERVRIDESGQLILLGNNGTTANSLDLSYNGTSGQAQINADSNGGSTHLSFGTSSSGSLSERARLDSFGNMGLGTNNVNNQSGYTSLTLNNATSGSIIDLRQNDTALTGGRLVGSANEFGLESRSQAAGSQISFYVNNVYTGRWTVDGLCFGNDTNQANALSDYEEGSWTPTPFLSYNPSSRGLAASGESGRYTKIGQIVHVWFGFNYSINGSGSFNLGISNLPFTVKNNASFTYNGGTAREAQFTGYMFFVESCIAGTTQLAVLRRYDNGSPRDPSGTMVGHVTYEAA